MTEARDEKETCNDGADQGCLFIIGLVIVACCIGSSYSPIFGWAVIGVGLMLLAVIPASRS